MNEEFQSLDENIVLESKNVGNVGDELLSAGGLVLGKRELPEVPLTGEVIAIGDGVPEGRFKLGEIVLLPPGNVMINVPDARYLRGEIKQRESRKMCSTHWKNVRIKYNF